MDPHRPCPWPRTPLPTPLHPPCPPLSILPPCPHHAQALPCPACYTSTLAFHMPSLPGPTAHTVSSLAPLGLHAPHSPASSLKALPGAGLVGASGERAGCHALPKVEVSLGPGVLQQGPARGEPRGHMSQRALPPSHPRLRVEGPDTHRSEALSFLGRSRAGKRRRSHEQEGVLVSPKSQQAAPGGCMGQGLVPAPARRSPAQGEQAKGRAVGLGCGIELIEA